MYTESSSKTMHGCEHLYKILNFKLQSFKHFISMLSPNNFYKKLHFNSNGQCKKDYREYVAQKVRNFVKCLL